MEQSDELENVRKKISSLFQDPLFKILLDNSFFTEIQLETLLIDYLTYQTLEPSVKPSEKLKARQFAEGRSRGSYNRVLRQSKSKLERTLYSVLLLGYLGILSDSRTSTFEEISQRMHEFSYARLRQSQENATAYFQLNNPKGKTEDDNELRKRLYRLISGRNDLQS